MELVDVERIVILFELNDKVRILLRWFLMVILFVLIGWVVSVDGFREYNFIKLFCSRKIVFNFFWDEWIKLKDLREKIFVIVLVIILVDKVNFF